MRNLGGAIGIALVDTILEQRTKLHADFITNHLQAGDATMAAHVGLPTDYFHGTAVGPVDDSMRAYVEPFVRHGALADSFNEAWVVLGVIFLISLVAVFFMRGGAWHPERDVLEV